MTTNQTHGNVSAILTGPTWTGTVGEAVTVSYSFDIGSLDRSVNYADNTTAFNHAQQQATLDAFNTISSVANITFVEAATSSAAQIHFYNGDLFGGNTYAGITGYYYNGSNKLTYAAVGMDSSQSDFATVGTYGYFTLLHEIGHAVGLKHSGNYGPGDSGPTLSAAEDSTDTTVMSYVPGSQGIPTNYRDLDIQAFQYMYGANETATQAVESASSVASNDGNDVLFAANAGELIGGLGSDNLTGSAGNDTLIGGRSVSDQEDSADTISGGDGNDLIYGNQGNDLLYGDNGADSIFGGFGEDVIYGNAGDDFIAGGGGIAHQEDNSDQIFAGSGNDSIVANGGNDYVEAGTGNDTIYGGFGNDTLIGGDGDDLLIGQIDRDVMSGGNGADTFYFQGNDGENIITDFTFGEDVIRLNSNLNGSGIYTAQDALAHVTQIGADLLLDLGGGSNVTLQNVNALSVDSFDIL